jgi:hypothetical protein
MLTYVSWDDLLVLIQFLVVIRFGLTEPCEEFITRFLLCFVGADVGSVAWYNLDLIRKICVRLHV